MLIKGKMITIEGNSLCAMITKKGHVLEIEYNCDDEEL